ncbi:hypothetical protein M2271_001303 [Streptomyces sp. LBL]|uniref:hypothetical protein n=1 Tax=Streptomyces sp. LBL TaxID=2940562 RepID=UPI0024733090|nr:hypothetical protein [Streptomyces sp. LBL]MDH6623516.1 hypothetical protein [Streptomyces sp. LBL]
MITASHARRAVVAAVAVTATALITTGGSAAADTTAANPYVCQINATPGLPYSLGFTSSAPAQVKKNRNFTVKVTPDAITPNPVHNDYSYDLTLKLRLPSNARLVSYHLTGGDTAVTSHVYGDDLVLEAAGPFPAKAPFQLPTVGLTLNAADAGVVTTSPGGTGYDDYGFGWDFVPSAEEAPHVPNPSKLRCYPNPARPITVTTVA